MTGGYPDGLSESTPGAPWSPIAGDEKPRPDDVPCPDCNADGERQHGARMCPSCTGAGHLEVVRCDECDGCGEWPEHDEHCEGCAGRGWKVVDPSDREPFDEPFGGGDYSWRAA